MEQAHVSLSSRASAISPATELHAMVLTISSSHLGHLKSAYKTVLKVQKQNSFRTDHCESDRDTAENKNRKLKLAEVLFLRCQNPKQYFLWC